MQIALAWKAHSGWSAMVALGMQDGIYQVVERSHVELVEEAWEKMPYHAADRLAHDTGEADRLISAAIAVAQRLSTAAIRAARVRLQAAGHDVKACAVVTGNPMPHWSTAEILAVHLRMHQAEGCLFREVLLRAAQDCGLPALAIQEKTLLEQASQALDLSPNDLEAGLNALGKQAGPPGGRDQKEAAQAAMLALR
jgi:hypothetical protein